MQRSGFLRLWLICRAKALSSALIPTLDDWALFTVTKTRTREDRVKFAHAPTLLNG